MAGWNRWAEKASGWVDDAVAVFSPQAALRRKQSRFRLDLTSQYYRGSETGRLMADWILSGQTSPDAPDYELDMIRGRSRDLNRNDPVAAGATETLSVNVIGSGLSPQSALRADFLGVSEDRAEVLRKQAENIWQSWKLTADAANRLTFDEIQFLAMRKIIEDGEIFAVPSWADEPWRPLSRVIELAESDRVVSDEDGFSYGIKLGARGQPLAYSFQSTADDGTTTYKVIEARDKDGRPKVLHVFPSKRVGQVRGVPYFAPVLQYFKHLGDYLEAEVVGARVAACLAVFVTKNEAWMGSVGNMSEQDSATNDRLQTLEPGLVSYLEQGEGINVVDPKRPSTAFQPFVEGILRLIGVSLGLPYELLLKDFSKTNYSSARAALLEAWRHFLGWRGWFSTKFCQPCYELVLEEAYLRGKFDAPDFYQNKSEYCRTRWIGPARGWVDPVKEVEASRKAIDFGLSTLAEEVAGQGRDWEEVLEQISRENQRIDELGAKVSRAQGGAGNANAQEERE